MNFIATGVVAAIGHTPLIEMTRAIPGRKFSLFGKLEGANPGGSMKDRSARRIIERSLETCLINRDTVIIESSSGNMGVGLAQVCRYYNLRFICVIDPKTTSQNRRLLEAYGADVDMVTEPDPISGEYLPARLARVRALLEGSENVFWPNQYSNRLNAEAHHDTLREIVDALDAFPDFIFCAISTCGTLRGFSDFLKQHQARTTIVAVDAVGSAIFGDKKGQRWIPGHGSSVIPELFSPELAQRHILVSDRDCIRGCRHLLTTEAILAGGSSGAVISAIQQLSASIPSGSICVAMLPDRGERYLDTIYSDSWIREHFEEERAVNCLEAAVALNAIL